VGPLEPGGHAAWGYSEIGRAYERGQSKAPEGVGHVWRTASRGFGQNIRMSWGELTIGGYGMNRLEDIPLELLAIFHDTMYRQRPFDPVYDGQGYEWTLGPRDRRRKVRYPLFATELVAPGAILADRLDAIGINRAAVLQYFGNRIKMADPGRINSENYPSLKNFTGEQWLSALTNELQTGSDDLFWIMLVDDGDHNPDLRFTIRAMLLGDQSQEVVLDISPFIFKEAANRLRMVEARTDVCSNALADMRDTAAINAPMVVLTEGATDARLLSAALTITHPHLEDLIRFMNFDQKAEGSASALAKLVRSFAAAGIVNRVIALSDNDTAAYDALHSIKTERFPENYRILHYPDLPFLHEYPTVGPQSDTPVIMNVNGSAGSLEMYLGRDLLEVEGQLTPVQWTGFIEGRRRYQGVLAKGAKHRIQEDFRRKIETARENPEVRAQQDWSGVVAIVELILAAFD
jgi:hypothetical protein